MKDVLLALARLARVASLFIEEESEATDDISVETRRALRALADALETWGGRS